MRRRWAIACAAVVAACHDPQPTIANHAPPLRPSAAPCGLAEHELASLEEITRDHMLHGAGTRLGSCEITRADYAERWQIRDRGTLIAEVIFDCGMVAYDPHFAFHGARVGGDADRVFPDPLHCQTGTLRLPDDAFPGASAWSTTLLQCTAPSGTTAVIVPSDPDPQRPELVVGATARELVRGRQIVAVYDFTCAQN